MNVAAKYPGLKEHIDSVYALGVTQTAIEVENFVSSCVRREPEPDAGYVAIDIENPKMLTEDHRNRMTVYISKIYANNVVGSRSLNAELASIVDKAKKGDVKSKQFIEHYDRFFQQVMQTLEWRFAAPNEESGNSFPRENYVVKCLNAVDGTSTEKSPIAHAIILSNFKIVTDNSKERGREFIKQYKSTQH